MKELLELIENLAGISITACDSGDVIVSCCSLSFDTSSHFVQRLEKHLKSSHHTKTVLVATSGKLALRYNLGVVGVLNALTGGPGSTLVKKVVRPGISVLNFYNKSNITEHLAAAKGNN